MNNNGEDTIANWVSTTEGAELVGYAPGHVRRLAREGKIRATKRGPRLWLVHKGDLLEHKRTAEPGRPRRSE